MSAFAAELEWAVAASAEYKLCLGRRADHVAQVATLAETVGAAFGDGRTLLVAAALVHDIGYAELIVRTGFHPLDGARHVRAAGFERLARLVAHHSGARREAALRGISDFEEEFPYEATVLDDALTYCDLTTGPDGQRVTLEFRIEEIANRYGENHVVARAIRAGREDFDRARDATEKRMADAGVTVTGSLAYPH